MVRPYCVNTFSKKNLAVVWASFFLCSFHFYPLGNIANGCNDVLGISIHGLWVNRTEKSYALLGKNPSSHHGSQWHLISTNKSFNPLKCIAPFHISLYILKQSWPPKAYSHYGLGSNINEETTSKDA